MDSAFPADTRLELSRYPRSKVSGRQPQGWPAALRRLSRGVEMW